MKQVPWDGSTALLGTCGAGAAAILPATEETFHTSAPFLCLPMDQKGKGLTVSVYISMVFTILASFNSILFTRYCLKISNILNIFFPLTSFAISANGCGENAAFRHTGGTSRAKTINQPSFFHGSESYKSILIYDLK